ncbi:4'-phosphopantetheinyl transferase superfamily protein [Aquimarina sp. D1M17]|uniref:4'-phosphopantetheinyl transferase family protein n=1 Tax=Aquimarina acroporae TaxID=2937283 RepID=UPI0020C0887D|nr:4'-phosphopantetheinyl transferase superfamily protein [Aquimarina acroporae]MCK8521587.1 4'-phosphopantetheinyl transferase superfamily protein [Aquimarina acroporae]
MTTIYYTLCQQMPTDEFEFSVSLLPADMQKRLRRFRRWQDAHAYLYGRLLLKEGMLRLGYDDSLESMKRTKYGKPYFEGFPFGFNISHSGKYVVCVISTDENENLGVDIEQIKPIVFDDFKCVFSYEERKKIDSYEKFYTFWTRKEAIVKADGRGMQIPLNNVDVTSMSTQIDTNKYYLIKVDIDKEYMLHIASLHKIDEVAAVDLLSITQAVTYY